MTKQERMQIAETIVKQMGGFGRLGAMVNGRDFVTLENGGVQFTFSGKRGMNKCVIKLDADDTYTMEFWYYNKRTYDIKKVWEMSGMYWDMLIPVFEQETGLYLSL